MSRNCYAKFTESGLPFPRTLHRSRLDTPSSDPTLHGNAERTEGENAQRRFDVTREMFDFAEGRREASGSNRIGGAR
jgi:hypothetical protein